jgi:hypothetical protein
MAQFNTFAQTTRTTKLVNSTNMKGFIGRQNTKNRG